MIKKVIYPGTFDPITNGHLDIIQRAAEIFEEVIVAVALSEDKNTMFNIKQRVLMAQAAIEELRNVKVKSFDSLLVDFCKKENAFIVIRGLRAVSDFEYELQMGYANSSLNSKIETLYLMPNLQNAFISSSVVRAIINFKGSFSHLVPQKVYEIICKEKKCM
jgi:pantetheine-phosphate adenylyltransferase